MGFEYIYAYLENLQVFFIIGTVVTSIAIFSLIVGRITNEIDPDDWRLLMSVAVAALVIFIIFDISPSMEHIKEVRAKVISDKTETKGVLDETHTNACYSSSQFIDSRMCSGR